MGTSATFAPQADFFREKGASTRKVEIAPSFGSLREAPIDTDMPSLFGSLVCLVDERGSWRMGTCIAMHGQHGSMVVTP